MDIKDRTPDLQQVFDKTWCANSYKTNGVPQQIANDKRRAERLFFGTGEKESRSSFEKNTVNQQLNDMQKKIDALNHHNNFR